MKAILNKLVLLGLALITAEKTTYASRGYLSIGQKPISDLAATLEQLEKEPENRIQVALLMAMENQMQKSGAQVLAWGIYLPPPTDSCPSANGEGMPEVANDDTYRVQNFSLIITFRKPNAKRAMGTLEMPFFSESQKENDQWTTPKHKIRFVRYRPAPIHTPEGASVSAGGGDKN